MSTILQDLSNALATTVENTDPSIVRVDGRRRLPATGIVWSTDGVIVSAHHVIERDEDITVTLADGAEVSATLVGRDPGTDIAVLRIDSNTAVTAADFADLDDLNVGNLVLALGKAGENVQATLGVVSAIGHGESMRGRANSEQGGRGRGRRGRGGSRRGMTLESYIQTDVVMYPGFSGGPLVDATGKVRGMNTSIVQGTSIAIPTPMIRTVVAQLLAHGRMKRGYLGITTQPVALPDNIKHELEQETGLLVIGTEPESPAAAAGLVLGDAIVAVDEVTVATIDDLMTQLSGDRIGQAVPFQILRGGELHDVQVTIGERP
jgi:S1-C subfamily serine protease